MLARYQLWPRVCLSVFVTNRCSLETSGRIKLVFLLWTLSSIYPTTCLPKYMCTFPLELCRKLWALENLATASHGKITAEVRAVLCLTVTYFLFQHILPLGSQFQLCSARYVRLLYFSYTLYFMGLVAWHSGRTSVSDWRTFPVLRSTCS